MNNKVLLDFTNKIYEFIEYNELEDKDKLLIMDYVDALYKKGVDLTSRDYEKEIYIFYHYHNKFNKILTSLGEDDFIDIISSAEIFKMKLVSPD